VGDRTEDLIRFLNASPTAYHAVEQAVSRLTNAGFIELDERDSWKLKKNTGYFVRRQGTSIIAFKTGSGNPADTSFRIVAAHTDSPGLKIKVDSENWKSGALRVTVEIYGGPIQATWFDRELSIAGRVLVGGGDGYKTELFNAVDPWAVIPNLAIHLNRDVNKGAAYNAQTQMRALLSVSVLESEVPGYLRRLLAKRMEVELASIDGYDLFLYPAEPARLVGIDKDMLMSSRIDNLGMSHAVLTALLDTKPNESTLVGALFDSEEIGSMTWQGARSWFLRDVLHRITLSTGGANDDFFRALAGSYMISGDAAHAVHPNYSEKHDEGYTPMLNRGPVVKIHAGQAYTTTGESDGKFVNLCRGHDIPVQRFFNRSDLPTGGTIGPVTSATLGIPSLDVGNPIWGMHSARETGGVDDQDYMTAALIVFFAEGL
jgi:aspartyl aminopeptidase